MPRQTTSLCPCESARNYVGCCGQWHAGQPAPDAEALMRSRYCAYVLGLTEYLMSTWHASTRPGVSDPVETDHLNVRWLGLDVRKHVVLGSDHAEVEFVARYRVGGGRAQRLHERGRFVREDHQWFYVDGMQILR